MPEIVPDHVPSPRTPLVWDGTAYRAVRGHTDGTVQVRGEDQHFSYRQKLLSPAEGVISGADGHFSSLTPDDGDVWEVTHISAYDVTSPTTAHGYSLRDGALTVRIADLVAAYAAGKESNWDGHLWMEHDDLIRVYFTGGLVGDTCRIGLIGYIMTLE